MKTSIWKEALFMKRNFAFNKFLNKQDFKPKNLIFYLDVVFPILFSFEKNDKLYLSYVITFDEFEKELNIITVELESYDILEKLIKSEVSVFEIFDQASEGKHSFFGYDSRNLFNVEIGLGDFCDILPTLPGYHDDEYMVEDLLPEDDFYIKKNLINKINLDEAKKYIENIKFYNNKINSDYRTSFVNGITREYYSKVLYDKPQNQDLIDLLDSHSNNYSSQTNKIAFKINFNGELELKNYFKSINDNNLQNFKEKEVLW